MSMDSKTLWAVDVAVVNSDRNYGRKEVRINITGHPDHALLTFRSQPRHVARGMADHDIGLAYLEQIATLLDVKVEPYRINDGAGNLIKTLIYLANDQGAYVGQANITMEGDLL